MKILATIGMGLVTSALLLVGCNGAKTDVANDAKQPQKEVKQEQSKSQNESVVKPTITEADLGYRRTTDLLKEDVIPPKVAYHSAMPGTSKKFPRAYQDAPPMIPHDTTGMLPITKDNNQCVMCHMPSVASSMGATPIPVSHFTNFRPHTTVKGDKILKNGKEIVNTSSPELKNVSIKVNKDETLYAGRFNCTQCHAPQATNELVDESKFTPVYTAPDGSTKSSWDQSKWLKHIKVKAQ